MEDERGRVADERRGDSGRPSGGKSDGREEGFNIQRGCYIFWVLGINPGRYKSLNDFPRGDIRTITLVR